MSIATKKTPKLTAREIAVKTAESLAEYFDNKKEADDLMKVCKEALINYAKTHPDEFDGKQSFKIGRVTIKKINETEYAVGEDFDPAEFHKAYPDSVKFSLVKSKMQNINLNQWGIDKSEQEKVSVEVK